MPLNGRLPDSDLAVIPYAPGRKLRKDVLPQFLALAAAFEAEFGKPLIVTDAYRDFDAQVRVKAAKGRLAAIPGTSNHGWGRAVDLGSMVNHFGSLEHRWMRENAPRFGWHLPLWARQGGSKPEAWHWETYGAVPVNQYRTTVPTVTVPTVDTNTPTPLNPEQTTKETIMSFADGKPFLVKDAGTQAIYYVHAVFGGTFRKLTAEDHAIVTTDNDLKVTPGFDGVNAITLARLRQIVVDINDGVVSDL